MVVPGCSWQPSSKHRVDSVTAMQTPQLPRGSNVPLHFANICLRGSYGTAFREGTLQPKRNAITNWAILLEFGYNQLHAMLSLWANWLQLNSQLNSPGVSFWLYHMTLAALGYLCAHTPLSAL